MRFTYAASQFELEFKRKKEEITLQRRDKDGQVILTIQESTHPYTTAVLYESNLNMTPKVLHMAIVGCAPGDKYSVKQGRIEALRKLTRKIEDKGLRKAVWEAYAKRGETRK